MLVLDHERLYIDLQKDLPSSTSIVPLPKSGGVSESYPVRGGESVREVGSVGRRGE